MMRDQEYRALVVDDESVIRTLTMRALCREGFHCDAAVDGAEAKRKFDRGSYDCVVTDLRMPNQHGHALATELLALDCPPVVVVLTGVLEPRLAKDLIAKGVESVEFKPVNYRFLAGKIRAMVHRRKRAGSGQPPAMAPRSVPRG